MTKRMVNNLKAIISFAIILVLLVLAIQTIWVGLNLFMYSLDAVEFDGLYEEVTLARNNKFYDSSNMYIKWLSNMDNDFIRVPFAFFVTVSPLLFVREVRRYNISKRRKRARVY